MNPVKQIPALVVVFLGLAVWASPAQGARAPIAGKLSKPGFTVIALAKSGSSKSVAARRGSFRIVPPAGSVSLHLRDAKGVYAGPVVIALAGRKAVTGVKAGARLGSVAVRRGHGRVVRRVARRFVDSSIKSTARRGVPIGAGVFGRVRASGSAIGGPGRDQDSDGIPGAFDVDDDGDLLLDNFERPGAARSAQLPPPGPPVPPGGGAPASAGFRIFSNLKPNLEEALNANAAAVTRAQIDGLVSRQATLAIQVPAGDEAELNCGGLGYCSTGGTGRSLEPFPSGMPFPAAFDSDGDGFGTIARGPTGDFQLRPGASADRIGSGDAFVALVRTGGTTTEVPGVLNYMFNTSPAPTKISAGGVDTAIGYPVAPGSPGTAGNPLTVGAGAVTMTFWRPQRQAIEGSGEGTGFVDIGHLRYTADVPNGPSAGPGATPSSGPGTCPANTYATADANLTIDGESPVDRLDDGPANPASTLTFTIDLDRCLATRGLTWSSGQTLKVDIQARSQFGDNAAVGLFFRRA